MRTIFKSGLLVLAVDTEEERAQFAVWREAAQGRVFEFDAGSAKGGAFRDLGIRAEACREPINITSKSPGELNLISNFAETSFELDGIDYGSVEAFWQGLKFPDEVTRLELAPLHGSEAKNAGSRAPQADTILYGGQIVRVGTWEHWALMERATIAKFEQNARARHALLSTGDRPLTHTTRVDSRTIPGVILAQIWERCRRSLRVSVV